MTLIFLSCLPCLWNQLLGGESGASGSSGAPQQNTDPGAKLVFQHQLGWNHWICRSSGFSGSLALFFFWKCYPCRELGIGALGPLAMERQVWIRCGCYSPGWQHLFFQTVFSSAQLHPKTFPSKQKPSVLRNQGDLVNPVTSNTLQ